MILPDANLILYSYIREFPNHQKSREWLEKVVSSGEIIGLSWQIITAFVRIGTNRKLFENPMTIQQVENSLGSLLSQPNAKLVSPTDRHWQIFTGLLKETMQPAIW